MAEILPLAGKYYGTRVEFRKPGSNAADDVQMIKIWTPDHFAVPFASQREIDAGWTPEDGHDHVEDAQSFKVANIICDALTAAGY